MCGTHRVPQWDYLRRAVVARLSSWAYRGLYSKFSLYAHAGYEMSQPQEVNRPSGLADFIALLAPIDTAMCLHQLSCGQTPCEVLVKYKALCAEFRSKTLGR